jgi:hypothetical protein
VRPGPAARPRDRRRRRGGRADRRADPGRGRLHDGARRAVPGLQGGAWTSSASSSSPTRCRPDGAGPGRASSASRATA